jgi:hypothetical protein
MHRGMIGPLLIEALLAGCESPIAAPEPMSPVPSFSFTQGPSELPNVLRSGGRIISVFADFEQDMAVIVGAPVDPTTDRICGGVEPRQFVPVQWVGDFDDIVKQLALFDEINVLVLRPIPPTPVEALCATEPIAVGTARFLRTDNDFFGAFGRANAVFELVQGTVALAEGGLARLTARFRALGSPEGELQWIDTSIHLRPIAMPAPDPGA